MIDFRFLELRNQMILVVHDDCFTSTSGTFATDCVFAAARVQGFLNLSSTMAVPSQRQPMCLSLSSELGRPLNSGLEFRTSALPTNLFSGSLPWHRQLEVSHHICLVLVSPSL